MAKRKSKPKPAAPRTLTTEDRLFIDGVRQAETAVQQQELRVEAAARKLREERAELKTRLLDLRGYARDLPLFDDLK